VHQETIDQEVASKLFCMKILNSCLFTSIWIKFYCFEAKNFFQNQPSATILLEYGGTNSQVWKWLRSKEGDFVLEYIKLHSIDTP
jgi:hypothetical protein